jgi:hypothetical protein
MFPLWIAELKDIIVHVQGERNVEVVRADRWMRSLRFCSFEVQKADLVPKKRPHVTLKGCEAVRGGVAKPMDANTLRKPY